jgi:hypothetical protein
MELMSCYCCCCVSGDVSERGRAKATRQSSQQIAQENISRANQAEAAAVSHIYCCNCMSSNIIKYVLLPIQKLELAEARAQLGALAASYTKLEGDYERYRAATEERNEVRSAH